MLIFSGSALNYTGKYIDEHAKDVLAVVGVATATMADSIEIE